MRVSFESALRRAAFAARGPGLLASRSFWLGGVVSAVVWIGAALLALLWLA